MHTLIFSIFFIFSFVITKSQTVDFVVYRLTNVGYISIPSNMEIQSGRYKKISETFQNEWMKKYSYEVFDDRVVFQQKGLNEFWDSGFDTYVRVIIETIDGLPGEYEKLSTTYNLSAEELNELSNDLKIHIQQELSLLGIKIIEWYGAWEVNLNGWAAIKISYLRQLNKNPPANVSVYIFPNNDRMHSLTTSYRQSDEKTWQPLIQKIVSSFTITNIR